MSNWIGWGLSALVVLFLLMDVGLKLAQLPIAVETTEQLGWSASSVVPLGIVLLACTVLYAVPQTSVLGAILLTGYLGGAVATHARIGSPALTHTLFGVYLGILMWGGLYLRDPRLATILPLRL
jgi:DoxX-like family